jgi:hypothetical protein
LLHAVPEKLEQVTISMETLLDLNSLSIEEIVGHLWAIEQRKKLPGSKEIGRRLLLTEEEWLACMKSREGSGSNSGARRKRRQWQKQGRQVGCGKRMKD